MKKGSKMTIEQRKRLSQVHLGQKAWNRNKKGWTNSGSFKKGHKFSEETRKKLSKAALLGFKSGQRKSPGLRGKNHPKWKGGITKGKNLQEYWQVKSLARHAKKQQAEGEYTLGEWLNLKNKYKNRCLSCKKKKPLAADHIIPLSRGGSNWISNIQPLCKSCNSKKHIQFIDYRKSYVQS